MFLIMAFFRKWLAIRKAKKEEKKHIPSTAELQEDDSEFKEDTTLLNKILAGKGSATRKGKVRKKARKKQTNKKKQQ